MAEYFREPAAQEAHMEDLKASISEILREKPEVLILISATYSETFSAFRRADGISKKEAVIFP